MAETRRRGAALENAILEAAWVELSKRGYAAMTFDAVAERAQTSKPVLYRRWPTKEALMLAAIQHRGLLRPMTLPDTGSVRGDAIALLNGFNANSPSIAGLFSTVLGSYFTETGTTPADLRAMIFGEGQSSMRKLVQRAMERGELPTADVPERITSLPSDLIRHELLMTLKPVPEATILEIIDSVFMPLLLLATEHRP